MRRPVLVAALLCAAACSTPDADAGPDLSAVHAAAPPASEQDCAATPDGEQIVRPDAAGEPAVTFPALPGWSVAADDSEIPVFAVTDGQSVFSVDVTSQRAADTSSGRELDLQKAALEQVPGWRRSEYRTGTVCGHSSITTVGTADLLLRALIAVTVVVIDGGEQLYTVTVRGQTTEPIDEDFLRDYPIMLSGLRITPRGA